METMLAFWTPGPMEMVVIGVVAVLIFGRSLPKIARNLGKSMVELKKGFKEYHDLEKEIENDVKDVTKNITK